MLVTTYKTMKRINEFDRPGVNQDDCWENALRKEMTLSLGGSGDGVWSWPFTPTSCHCKECVELYLHSHIGLHGVLKNRDFALLDVLHTLAVKNTLWACPCLSVCLSAIVAVHCSRSVNWGYCWLIFATITLDLIIATMISETIAAFHIALVALLKSLPVIWCEECTWNFGVLQRVHLSNIVFPTCTSILYTTFIYFLPM
jgi:hypothetical protein